MRRRSWTAALTMLFVAFMGSTAELCGLSAYLPGPAPTECSLLIERAQAQLDIIIGIDWATYPQDYWQAWDRYDVYANEAGQAGCFAG